MSRDYITRSVRGSTCIDIYLPVYSSLSAKKVLAFVIGLCYYIKAALEATQQCFMRS